MTLLETNSRPVRLRSFLVPAHSHPCTHTLTLTHTNPLTHTHRPPHTYPYTHTHSHIHSLTHTHTHTHTRLQNSINSAGSSVSADSVSLTIAPAKHKAFSCFNGDRQSVCFCNYRLSFCHGSTFWGTTRASRVGKSQACESATDTREESGWGREASSGTSGNC